jgi:hypothetical protein
VEEGREKREGREGKLTRRRRILRQWTTVGGILRNSGVQEVRYIYKIEISCSRVLDLEVDFLPFRGSLELFRLVRGYRG